MQNTLLCRPFHVWVQHEIHARYGCHYCFFFDANLCILVYIQQVYKSSRYTTAISHELAMGKDPVAAKLRTRSRKNEVAMRRNKVARTFASDAEPRNERERESTSFAQKNNLTSTDRFDTDVSVVKDPEKLKGLKQRIQKLDERILHSCFRDKVIRREIDDQRGGPCDVPATLQPTEWQNFKNNLEKPDFLQRLSDFILEITDEESKTKLYNSTDMLSEAEFETAFQNFWLIHGNKRITRTCITFMTRLQTTEIPTEFDIKVARLESHENAAHLEKMRREVAIFTCIRCQTKCQIPWYSKGVWFKMFKLENDDEAVFFARFRQKFNCSFMSVAGFKGVTKCFKTPDTPQPSEAEIEKANKKAYGVIDKLHARQHDNNVSEILRQLRRGEYADSEADSDSGYDTEEVDKSTEEDRYMDYINPMVRVIQELYALSDRDPAEQLHVMSLIHAKAHKIVKECGYWKRMARLTNPKHPPDTTLALYTSYCITVAPMNPETRIKTIELWVEDLENRAHRQIGALQFVNELVYRQLVRERYDKKFTNEQLAKLYQSEAVTEQVQADSQAVCNGKEPMYP